MIKKKQISGSQPLPANEPRSSSRTGSVSTSQIISNTPIKRTPDRRKPHDPFLGLNYGKVTMHQP
jgi:hypothetical protein